MCLSIPGKITEINGKDVIVDYNTEKRKAKTLLNVEIGDYVIINGGLIIEKIPKEDAIQALKITQCNQN